jgi:tetratricopeptide (TPR) repeat protein
MLRTLPKGAAFFMEGGDDAFYSLAYLHEAKGLRPDLEMHDRGGLIYRSPYGADFRQLPREAKKIRRIEIEKTYYTTRPLFYSTMDNEVLPGIPLRPAGFLMEVVAPTSDPRLDWEHLILRSLYPPEVSNYRTRALAAFFPFMKGRSLLDAGEVDRGLAYWRRAAVIGSDVDWTTTNLTYEYAHRAYAALEKGKAAEAEKFYRAWLVFRPLTYEARSNLAVALQRQGKLEEALRENEQTAQVFPAEADPLYNNAVALWPSKDWPRIKRFLESALARNPRHQAAAAALAKINGGKS